METLTSPQRRPIYSKLKAWGVKPLVLDFYVQRVWPTFSLERILAKVAAIRPASQNAFAIRLRPNFNFKNFQAGQHVLVTTAINGHRLTRTYSPTLLGDNSFEITVKQVPGGKLSSHLTNVLKRGSTVEISAPFGEMTWARLPKSKRYIFCAGGIGITPLRSLLRAWDKNPRAEIELHYWAKTESEFCFKDEFQDIAARHPNLKLHFHVSRSVSVEEATGADVESMIVACGPENFVHAARTAASARGQKFFGEFAPISTQPAADQLKETFFEVTYAGQTIQASSRKTILESLEAQGLTPVHGCRMGLCKSCTCMKISGSTFSSKDQALAEGTNENIQICVSSPRSRVSLEKY